MILIGSCQPYDLEILCLKGTCHIHNIDLNVFLIRYKHNQEEEEVESFIQLPRVNHGNTEYLGSDPSSLFEAEN